jgi:TonB-linked SusC/RagA family outer membrane protein
MPTRPRFPVALAAAFLLVAPSVDAQQVTGTVRDGRSGQPMAAVQVFIPGTGVGALSQQNGRYLLLNVPAGSHTITAQRIGYGSSSQRVTVAAGQTAQLDFTLTEEALGLDEIIVTGTPGGTQRRAIGNAVTSVDVSEVAQKVQVATMQDLLTGRSPGAQFSRVSGNVGTGARIQIRGQKSFSLTADPLIFVDGIRIDNKINKGPSLGDNREVNPLDDINPQDIQSIEIIKGPAAATLYGTEASAGVIQIITKRGAQGDASFEMSVRQGANYLRDPAGRLGDFWTCTGDVKLGHTANDVCAPESGRLKSYNPYVEGNYVIEDGTIRFPTKNLFQTGPSQSYNLAITGGTSAARYFLSTNYDYDEGVEYWNSNKALRLRANVNVVFSEKFTLDVSTGFTDGFTRFGQQAPTDGGIWEDLVWGNGFQIPRINNGSNNVPRLVGGFQEHLPYDVSTIDVTRDFQRFTGSATLQIIPTSWLTTRAILGLDRGWEVNNTFFPLYAGVCGLKNPADCRDPVYPRTREGEITFEKPSTNNVSLDLGATARLQLTQKLGSASSVGMQYYTRTEESFMNIGRGFASPLSTTVNQTPVSKAEIRYDYVENKSAGFYVQEELNLNQRLFVTGALRFDDNSAFGEELDPEIYPKLAATWTLSDEAFFSVPKVNSFRLRSAWGTSGRQPDAFARVTRYGVIGGPSGTTALAPAGPGNTEVGPEKSTELELGFDVALLDSRVSSEFTWFRSKTEGALLNIQPPPSMGASPSSCNACAVQRNLGRLDNWGWEATLNSRLYESSLINVSLDLTGSHVDNEIKELGDFPGNNTIKLGYPYPVYATRYFITSAAYDANGRVVDGFGRKIKAFCDSGVRLGDTAKHGLVRGGEPVDCQSKNAEALLFGRSFYTYRFSVTPTFSLFENALTLHVMADGAHGKKSQYTRDAGARYNNYYQSRCECDPFWVAGDRYGTGQVWGYHNASFWKLRELGARYQLPGSLLGRIGAERGSMSVTWREIANLWVAQQDNWGARIGDPEESRVNEGSANYRTMPPLSRISGELRLNF